MLELRQLRYFIALAQTRSFTRAARQLNMAQPPLSRQIQWIEDYLGVQLVDRSRRPLELTPAGQLFHDQAVQVVGGMNRLEETMRGHIARARPRLKLGFVASAIYGWLPDVLRAFRADHPEIDLLPGEFTSLEQWDALKAGRIDMGIARHWVDDPALEQILLHQEPLVLAVPAGHALAEAAQNPGLAALAGEELLVYPGSPRPSFADTVQAILAEHQVVAGRIMELREMQTALGLVAAGAGLCLVPEAARRSGRSDVRFLNLAEKVETPVVLSLRRGDRTIPVVRMCAMIARLFGEWGWPVVPELARIASGRAHRAG